MIRELDFNEVLFRESLRDFLHERYPRRIVLRCVAMGDAWDAVQAERRARTPVWVQVQPLKVAR